MFTGLVESLGEVRDITADGPGYLLTISEPRLSEELIPGESISVNGTCLTVVERDSQIFRFQVGPETLQKTNLGDLATGDFVNLERALRLQDRLGGHLVQGHVDGVGRISRRIPDKDWEWIWFECASELSAHMVPRGSIAIDGISLTLVEVAAETFSVALIPHTLARTTLGKKGLGAKVNLEVDMFSKYVHKYLEGIFNFPNR